MKKNNKRGFVLLMTGLLLIQLVVLIFYGSQKTGFHEDELYSYYSSNKTAGLFLKDREWVLGETLREELVVLPGEQFRYSVVKQMQSWDVHPPIYYYLLHTVCSLSPGVFSKWQGIAVNLAGYVICYFLLALLAYRVACRSLKEESYAPMAVTFLTCCWWGFSAAVISGVMFIRMYQWLTVFVLLCMWLHVRAVEEEHPSFRSFYLPLGITVFLGFLTQYFYIIFHVFLGAGFCIYLLMNKRWKSLAAYVGTCAVSLGAALLYYPSALSHIFRGYRGTEAVGEFSDVSNTMGRLRFFVGLFNEYVTGGWLAVWLLMLCLLALTRYFLKKRGHVFSTLWDVPVNLLLLDCGGYFFTVAKTSLLLGETSNRYELPIYGMLLLLLVLFTWKLSTDLFLKGKGKKRLQVMTAIGGCLVLLSVLPGFLGHKVFFLYPEEKELAEYVEHHTENKAVVLYYEESGDHMWWLLDELGLFQEVYMASLSGQEAYTDKELQDADTLVVYVADCEEGRQGLQLLKDSCKMSGEERLLGIKNTWSVYELHKP